MTGLEIAPSSDIPPQPEANRASPVVDASATESRDAWSAFTDTIRTTTQSALQQFGNLEILDSSQSTVNTSGQQTDQEQTEHGEIERRQLATATGQGDVTPTTQTSGQGDLNLISTMSTTAAVQGDSTTQTPVTAPTDASPTATPATEQGAARPRPRQLDLHASSTDIRDYLRNNRQGVDYGSLFSGDNRLVLLGDIHRSPAIHEHVAQSAADLQRAGVTHFALEMIPASMQGTLDRFYEGNRQARQEISQYLNRTWEQNYPGSANEYMQILDAMRENRIRPVGLDVHNHLDDTPAHARQRDQAWAHTLQNLMRTNPNARVVAFGGSQHFGEWNDNTTSSILQRDHNIRSNTVHFVGGDNRITHTGVPDAEARDRELHTNVVPRLSQQERVGNRAFMIPIDSERFIANTFIHLPQRTPRPQPE